MFRHQITAICIVLAALAATAATAAAQQGPAPTQPPPGWAWHPQAGWVWVGTQGQPPAPQQPTAPQQPSQPQQPAYGQPPAVTPHPASGPATARWGQPAQAPAAPAGAGPEIPQPDDWRSRVREAAMRPRLTLQGYSGVGGEAEARIGHDSETSDMEPSPGVAATFVMPLAPYFAIGALTGIRFWRDGFTEQLGLDDHLMWDIDALMQVRLPFSATGSQVYLNVPIGLSLNFMDDAGVDWDEELATEVGFNYGFTAGVQVMFSRVFGLMAEMGYAHHEPKVSFSKRGGGHFDIDWSFEQVTFNTGLTFAF